MHSQETIRELKKLLHGAKCRLHPDRQRLTLAPEPGEACGQVLEDSANLADYKLKDGSSVLFKDQGPLVGRGVCGVPLRCARLCAV